MAYDHKKLLVWAYHSGHTLWRYDTDDPLDAVCCAGYFNDAADMLRHKDVINIVSTPCPGEATYFRWVGVSTPMSMPVPLVLVWPFG